MKKRIGYLLLIIISIVGSRLIFGRDYHLNSTNLKEENLYVYNNFDSNRMLSTYVDEEEFYYVSVINEDKKVNQYSVIKYNLTSNKKEEEYIFNSDKKLENVHLFEQNSYIYLTSNSNFYYKFDKNLTVLGQGNVNTKNIDMYGIYKDKIVYTINNDIYYVNDVYGSVPVSCGKNKEIIYDHDTYLHFYNENTGFGCLYNLVDRKIEYLDYENVDIVKNKLLEYQGNRLSFKYDGDTYYFNDITESNNLKMHNSGDYLFTIDTTSNKLKIYNIESRKIIYEKTVLDINGAEINNIMIDDYVYFITVKDNKTILYVWDYLKDVRRSIDMIDYNEKEYKFKNNELKEEIKNNYNIDVYIYDQAVDYFDNYYVIPSYDDILINSRLITLKEVLDSFNKDEIANINNVIVFFDKDIVSNSEDNKVNALSIYKNDYYILAINITDDNFKDNFTDEIVKIYPNLIIDNNLGE